MFKRCLDKVFTKHVTGFMGKKVTLLVLTYINILYYTYIDMEYSLR